MINIQTDKITWFDVMHPDAKDIETMQDAFGLHPLIADELRGPSARGKAEFHDSYVYLVVHFPFYDAEMRTSSAIEIDVVVSKNKIATVRYEEFPPIEEFATRCEAVPGFSENCLGDTPAHFLYRLFEYLFDYALRELKHIDEKLSAIEEGIFGGNERKMIKAISYVKRDILDFSRIIHPMGGILESLATKGTKLYGAELGVYFEDLMGDFARVTDRIENYKDTIESLETTNQSLVTSKIDEVMRILSVLAFLIAPFTIIGALFQMNTRFTPILGTPNDWWWIAGSMAFGSALLYFVFKRKGWL